MRRRPSQPIIGVEFVTESEWPISSQYRFSFFEVAVDYERPEFKLWIDRASIVQGIFHALKPWSPSIDDTELHTAGRLSEQGVTIKLPLKRVSFFFGPAYCKLTRDDADWGSIEEATNIVDAGLSALIQLSGVAMGTKKTVIALHIQPRTRPFMEILNPFVPAQLAALDAGTVRTMATVAKWEARKVTIDGSGALANGVFLKF